MEQFSHKQVTLPVYEQAPPMAKQRVLRVGIDVGGTFTDLVATESWSGRNVTRKLTSTPTEPERAVIAALLELLDDYDPTPAIEFLAHSTTIATNALLGQIGLELPRVVLVTTDGFRDLVEIGRQNRSEVYNLFVARPRPLVAREDRLTVRERIDYRGGVVIPLDDDSLERVCNEARARAPASLAICLLHSYVNDAHERRLAEALAVALPGVRIALSSEVDPQYREYERCSTTVVNAALAPIVERYLESLVSALRAHDVDAPLYIMRSDGGMSTATRVMARPATVIESGPASGAIAAAALGTRLGAQALLSFDMGGTTAKAGTIVDGIAQVAYEFEAAGATHSGRAIKGSGYPVRFPFVDLAEVSAGGGTIAWIDDAGTLRVGPISAGADPGPACYGTSDRPAVTDANVVLGRLHQRHLLGGGFPIDASRARASVSALARRLDMSVEETAAGIVALVDDAMAKALRIVTIERGIDPRGFTLVAFGGGGPLHACALCDDLDIRRALVPAHPGLFSAFGLLDAELRVSSVCALLCAVDTMDGDFLERYFAATEARARAQLLQQGANAHSVAFRREFDARYRGQSFELTMAYDSSPEGLAQRFHAAHRARYGYDVPGEVIEIVSARSTATARLASSPCHRNLAVPSGVDGDAAQGDNAEVRRLWIDGAFGDVPVFPRNGLRTGTEIVGPAIVEQYDATTYVAPAWKLTLDGDLLVLEKGAR